MSTAREALDVALVGMAARGEKPVCAWPDRSHLWTSDDHEDRARAARRCAGCEVIAECGAAADEVGERFGVWAGVDRQPSPQARRAAKGATS